MVAEKEEKRRVNRERLNKNKEEFLNKAKGKKTGDEL